MSHTSPTRPGPRRAPLRRRRFAALVFVGAAVAAAPGYQPSGPTTSTAAERRDPPRERRGALDRALGDALRRASADASAEGVEIVVTSGRRSPEHQRRLLREAVAEYGSEAEAARWVATPETSPHVSGDAVDVGPSGARAWLSEHGARYGLCQIYGNEPWHFELRPDAPAQGCPPMYPDPTHDPRMRFR